MRADIHDGPEHMLQSEAGYIDARPLTPARQNLLQRTAGPYIGSKSEETRHQEQSGDQFGRAEQDQRDIEKIEMMQQKADDMVGSEQCAGHRRLEFVGHPRSEE